jgi:dTMP kinase
LSLFIVFEGGEGCGKSTQAGLLLRKLEREGIAASLTREPGGTALGNEIRRLLKKRRDSTVSPLAELYLFAASRVQLVDEVIRPALLEGRVVICDRFADSTVAYQGFGRGLDMTSVSTVNVMATDGLRPDLTVLLDVPVEEGLRRKRGAGDRFEIEELSFHYRIRDGYLKMAASEPDRWLLIDASLPRRAIADMIWKRVSSSLSSPP